MAKQVSPGVLALRKVVDDVYADAREAKKQGKLVGESGRLQVLYGAARYDRRARSALSFALCNHDFLERVSAGNVFAIVLSQNIGTACQ